MLLCDFHIHSTFSDGKLSIPEIVDFYGRRGFGAIAITDHLCDQVSFLGKTARILKWTLTKDNFPAYLETIAEQSHRAWEQYRMIVIPGVELTKNSLNNHRSAHILALGIQSYIDAKGDVSDLLRSIRGQDAISVAAHPVDTRKVEPQTYHLWDRREELQHLIDAWEVASGPILFDEVKYSGLPMLANSDLHRPEQMQSWKTVVHAKKSKRAILDAIRCQNVNFRFYWDSASRIEDSYQGKRSYIMPELKPLQI